MSEVTSVIEQAQSNTTSKLNFVTITWNTSKFEL